MTEPFITWAVYENPSDYPGKFVVRRWKNDVPEKEPVRVVDSLAQAREHIPIYLAMFLPSVGDDPVIVETWI